MVPGHAEPSLEVGFALSFLSPAMICAVWLDFMFFLGSLNPFWGKARNTFQSLQYRSVSVSYLAFL